MSKLSTNGRTSGTRPSRIRRDPPPPVKVKQAVVPSDPEREAWTVVIGVLLFGLAITIIIFALSDYTSG